MIRVASIVEGHGEVEALPILLRRIGVDLLNNTHVEALTPIRQPRNRLVRNFDQTTTKAIELAKLKLASLGEGQDIHDMILLLIDADDGCAAEIADELQPIGQQVCQELQYCVVLPVVEFETWFVASADSLKDYLDISSEIPEFPEQTRSGKGWIAKRTQGQRYSETIDQPRLASKMNLETARARSPSFDKLCRSLESVVRGG